MALLFLSPSTLSFHHIASSKSKTHHSIFNECKIVGLTTITQCSRSPLSAAAADPLVEDIIEKERGSSQHDNKKKKKNSNYALAEVATLCKEGQLKEAMEILSSVEYQTIPLHSDVYAHLLEACAKCKALAYGTQIHTHMLNSRIKQTPFLWSKLVRMYTCCGSLKDAHLIFEDMKEKTVFAWNAMITGYVTDGLCEDALALYYSMKRDGLRPDKYTFPRVLKACGGIQSLQVGKKVHYDILRRGLESDLFIGNALIDMYAKCGCIELARQVFDKMPQRDLVSWNTIIAGCQRNGQYDEVLLLFHNMTLEGVNPDAISVASVLPACAYFGLLKQGKEIHQYIFRSRINLDAFVGCGLIDMYSNCGRIENARQVFDTILKRDLFVWSAMINGYAVHGHGKSALLLFKEMISSGEKPDHVTLLALLYACNHSGMVNEGRKYFSMMTQSYGLTPKVEHYSCMVDLLGRGGFLGEAQNLIARMPIEADASVFGALLSACRIHGNIMIAESVANHLFELEPNNPANFVLLSNIYAASGRWEQVAMVREAMEAKGLRKVSGCSWIEIKNRVYTFLVGDTSHPQSDQIYEKLKSLVKEIEEAGYVPDTSFVLHDVEEKKKRSILFGHSEKLTIAFGLISTNLGTTIQFTNNLRLCGDCHNATKLISKTVRREIIIRDPNRFHHFKNGLCSCGDYW